jgi:hypothetical protein
MIKNNYTLKLHRLAWNKTIFNFGIIFIKSKMVRIWVIHYLLSECFMASLEKKLLDTNNLPNVWFRYVDDVFAVIKKSEKKMKF